jgi:hypothetical protein
MVFEVLNISGVHEAPWFVERQTWSMGHQQSRVDRTILFGFVWSIDIPEYPCVGDVSGVIFVHTPFEVLYFHTAPVVALFGPT